MWPVAYSKFISAFAFFNFDFIPWQKLGCVVPMDYLDKVRIIGLLPIGLALGIATSVFLPSMLCCNRNETEIDKLMRQVGPP